jgi:hypothetical protein
MTNKIKNSETLSCRKRLRSPQSKRNQWKLKTRRMKNKIQRSETLCCRKRLRSPQSKRNQ